MNGRASDESCELDVQVRGPTLVLDDGGDDVRSMQLLYVVPALVSIALSPLLSRSCLACRLSDHPSKRVFRRSLRGQPCLDANAASASVCLVALLRCYGPALFQPTAGPWSLIRVFSHSCTLCPMLHFAVNRTGANRRADCCGLRAIECMLYRGRRWLTSTRLWGAVTMCCGLESGERLMGRATRAQFTAGRFCSSTRGQNRQPTFRS